MPSLYTKIIQNGEKKREGGERKWRRESLKIKDELYFYEEGDSIVFSVELI